MAQRLCLLFQEPFQGTRIRIFKKIVYMSKESIHTAVVELRPPNHNKDGLWTTLNPKP